MKTKRSILFALALPLLVAADYDTTKLPEGSVWEGTFKVRTKKEVVFDSAITIKITKREKTSLAGEWTNEKDGAIYKIKGTINGNKVTFKFIGMVQGNAPTGVIGSLAASGTLAVHDDETKISGTTTNPDKPNNSGTWEATLKKD